jgi:OOP family OmpA-OmpF porin
MQYCNFIRENAMTLTSKSGRLGLLALALLTSPFAAAQNSNWYIGGNVGRSRADIDDGRYISSLAGAGLATTSFRDDNRDTGFKLFGGYQLSKNFALEGGYFDLGKFNFSAITNPPGTLNGDFKIKGINLDAVGILPFGEKFSAFGRLGVQYAETRDSFSRTGAVPVLLFNPNPSTRATNVKFGAGLQYDFTPSFGMRLEAERYRINDAVGGKGNVDLVSVGLVYRFGGKMVPVAARGEAVAPTPYVAPARAVVAPPPPPQAVVQPQETAPPPAPVEAPARRDRN